MLNKARNQVNIVVGARRLVVAQFSLSLAAAWSNGYPPSSGRANSGWPIQVGQFRLGQFRFIPIQVNPDSVYQGRIQVVPIQVGANSGWG